MSKPYHKRFTRFKPETLVATKRLRRGWSTKTEQQRWQASREWLATVSAIYGVPPVELNTSTGADCYKVRSQTIYMSKPSIITLLHEFRHHLQFTVGPEGIVGSEPDARAWSLSLYYRVAPRTLRLLAQQDRIFHLTPNMTNRAN